MNVENSPESQPRQNITEEVESHLHPPPVPLRQGVAQEQSLTAPSQTLTTSAVHDYSKPSSDPTYADPVLLTSTINCIPQTTDPVIYDGLKGFQNSQVSILDLLDNQVIILS